MQEMRTVHDGTIGRVSFCHVLTCKKFLRCVAHTTHQASTLPGQVTNSFPVACARTDPREGTQVPSSYAYDTYTLFLENEHGGQGSDV